MLKNRAFIYKGVKYYFNDITPYSYFEGKYYIVYWDESKKMWLHFSTCDRKAQGIKYIKNNPIIK